MRSAALRTKQPTGCLNLASACPLRFTCPPLFVDTSPPRCRCQGQVVLFSPAGTGCRMIDVYKPIVTQPCPLGGRNAVKRRQHPGGQGGPSTTVGWHFPWPRQPGNGISMLLVKGIGSHMAREGPGVIADGEETKEGTPEPRKQVQGRRYRDPWRQTSLWSSAAGSRGRVFLSLSVVSRPSALRVSAAARSPCSRVSYAFAVRRAYLTEPSLIYLQREPASYTGEEGTDRRCRMLLTGPSITLPSKAPLPWLLTGICPSQSFHSPATCAHSGPFVCH